MHTHARSTFIHVPIYVPRSRAKSYSSVIANVPRHAYYMYRYIEARSIAASVSTCDYCIEWPAIISIHNSVQEHRIARA